MSVLRPSRNSKMKKTWLILLAGLLLAGCGENVPSSSETSSVTDTSSVVSSIEEPSSSVEEGSSWNEQTLQVMEDTYQYAIPYCDNDSYKTALATNDFGMPALWVYCFYEDDDLIDTNILTYTETLKEDGWSVEKITYNTTAYSYDVYNAEKEFSDTCGVRLSVLSGGIDGKYCLGILGEKYIPFDVNEWPKSVISETVNYDVPSYKGNGFIYDAYQKKESAFGIYAIVTISNVDASVCLNEYAARLEEANWTVEDQGQGYYLAYTSEIAHQAIQFYYDPSAANCMVICITSCTPSQIR